MKRPYVQPLTAILSMSAEELTIQISGVTHPEEADARGMRFTYTDLSWLEPAERGSVWDLSDLKYTSNQKIIKT